AGPSRSHRGRQIRTCDTWQKPRFRPPAFSVSLRPSVVGFRFTLLLVAESPLTTFRRRSTSNLSGGLVAAVILNFFLIAMNLVHAFIVGQFDRRQQFRVAFAGHEFVSVLRQGLKLHLLAERVL